MEGQCQCGTIRFTTPLPKPIKMYVCHCLSCRAQSSSAFGISASFPAFSLPESNAADIGVYTYITQSGREKKCFFCKHCGSRIMHSSVGRKYVNVKGGCLHGLDKELLSTACHIWTKRAITPIPEGVEQYEEEPLD